MKKHMNQLRSGVYLSYINLLLGSIVPMIYTPIMLKLLGETEHGLYALANSVIGYLSLLSFGFGSTILRYLSKYRAENDKAAIQRTFGFFLLLYGALAMLVMLQVTELHQKILVQMIPLLQMMSPLKILPLQLKIHPMM